MNTDAREYKRRHASPKGGQSFFIMAMKRAKDSTPSERPLELPIGKRPKDIKHLGKPVEETEPRDPRFDQRCAGSNDPRHFVRNYSFLDDVRKKELAELKSALRREKDPDKVRDIQSTISRFVHKMEHRNNVNLLPGTSERKPKKQVKKQIIVEKFRELKETGKLSKYLERKRKKFIKRDGRRFGTY